MTTIPVAPSYWENASLIERRAMLALLAYAAGDAYGFQCEFIPRIQAPAPTTIGTKPGWPAGGVSDDTLLTRLTILALSEQTPAQARLAFLDSLQTNLSELRGLGPTTRSALGLQVKESELHQVGTSNGGMMRTAICGIAFSDPILRFEWISALTEATHNRVVARDCAIALATAYGEFDQPIRSVMLAQDLDPRIRERIANLDSWIPPSDGISNDSLDTLSAVIQIAECSQSLLDTYHRAVLLGGDTDTVAALSAGLYALKNPDAAEFLAINWLDEVDWSELDDAMDLVEILLSRRKHDE